MLSQVVVCSDGPQNLVAESLDVSGERRRRLHAQVYAPNFYKHRTSNAVAAAFTIVLTSREAAPSSRKSEQFEAEASTIGTHCLNRKYWRASLSAAPLGVPGSSICTRTMLSTQISQFGIDVHRMEFSEDNKR